MIRILCVGSESWLNIDAIWRELEPHWKEHRPKVLVAYPDGGVLSGQIGALCKTAGIDRAIFPLNDKQDKPEWRRLRIMFRMVEPDLVLAFHPFIQNSKTTKMALELAANSNIPSKVIAK